jgi:hypothetical protein
MRFWHTIVCDYLCLGVYFLFRFFITHFSIFFQLVFFCLNSFQAGVRDEDSFFNYMRFCLLYFRFRVCRTCGFFLGGLRCDGGLLCSVGGRGDEI